MVYFLVDFLHFSADFMRKKVCLPGTSPIRILERMDSMHFIDLRSDTVTQPTEEMREAMARAVVGDDVYGDDPTVNRLEALAAEKMGKEAALFVPTGTMGNQLAIMAHTRPGDEMIAGVRSHTYLSEGGGAARFSGVSCATVDRPDDFIGPEDVRACIRPNDCHYPVTTLLCLENATNGGTVIPLGEMRASCEAARENGLAIHLDGARVFNTALSLGVRPEELAAPVDSVMFCLSKGLCSPVGSMLCGSKAFVEKARRGRKAMGGGMRQAGVLAACGLLSLEKMTLRLQEDHDNARHLASLLADIPGIEIDPSLVHINMVWWRPLSPGFSASGFTTFLRENGVLANGEMNGRYRFVTSREVTKADVETAAGVVKQYFKTLG